VVCQFTDVRRVRGPQSGQKESTSMEGWGRVRQLFWEDQVLIWVRRSRARPAEWAEGEHFDGRVGTSATTVLGGSGADMGEKVTQVMPVGRRNRSGSGGGSSKSGYAGPRQRSNGMPLRSPAVSSLS
jgi:hypothetical protein